MKNLVVYTTKHGCTEKCVQKLQSQLTGETMAINLKEKAAPDIDNFDTVILGGSIYASNTQKPLKQFAANQLDRLLQKKVFLFLCSGFQKDEEFQINFPKQLIQHAAMKSLFGGELIIERLNFLRN